MATNSKPLFTLLVAPHPAQTIAIELELILNGLHRQTAHDQLHSFTLVCSPPRPCPPTPARVQRLTSLNAFYPPPEVDAVLLLESGEGLSELNQDWLANALTFLLAPNPSSASPIVSPNGLARATHHRLPTRLECVVGSRTVSGAELALAPFLLRSHPWSRLTDLVSEDWLAQAGLPALRLSLDLFARELLAFIPPSLDTSTAWKKCEHSLEAMRQSAGGPALEAELIQHLDNSLFTDSSSYQRMMEERGGQGKLCMILEEITDLDKHPGGWAETICLFVQRGYTVDVLVVVKRLDNRREEKRRVNLLRCIVDIEILSGSGSDGRRGMEPEARWTKFFISRQYSVLLYPQHTMDPIIREVLERKLGAEFGRSALGLLSSSGLGEQSSTDMMRMVVIGLPSHMIESADWITGLELRALRS